MKIVLIAPAFNHKLSGNRLTALRYTRLMQRLGHRVQPGQKYAGAQCDLMIALHARRSFDSIVKFRRLHPRLPMIVVLTGTDLYRDIRSDKRAQDALEMASRLVVLQKQGLMEIPMRHRKKTRIIYQAARKTRSPIRRPVRFFRVCSIGHMRSEKDPFRIALAARIMPASSRMKVLHIGRALDQRMKNFALRENKRNPRYRWVGELPHWKALRYLAGSHLLVLTSRIEGSANVLSEALAASVPAVTTRIPGLVGTLGDSYPGYFPVGDTRALAHMLFKAESDPKFYADLQTRCEQLAHLVSLKREMNSWRSLLEELF